MPEEEKISYYLKKSKTLENNFEKKIHISIPEKNPLEN